MSERCPWCHLTAQEETYLLHRGQCWNVYLADKQDDIGRCILVLRRHCAALSGLLDAEWAELKELIDRLEPAITAALGATMFNWSCLLNDFYKAAVPNAHLHIHVRPRYQTPVQLCGKAFADTAFGHHYDHRRDNRLTDAEKAEVFCRIKERL